MKIAAQLTAVVALACLSSGCMTHTVISEPSFYPPQLKAYESAEAQFTAYVSAHGASGKAYTDRTPKTVYISLAKRGGSKTTAKVIISAADLSWSVSWKTPGEPVLHFYDLPDGASVYDAHAKRLRREIRTKHFRYNPDTDTFEDLSR
jgi:hypothetical protein